MQKKYVLFIFLMTMLTLQSMQQDHEWILRDEAEIYMNAAYGHLPDAQSWLPVLKNNFFVDAKLIRVIPLIGHLCNLDLKHLAIPLKKKESKEWIRSYYDATNRLIDLFWPHLCRHYSSYKIKSADLKEHDSMHPLLKKLCRFEFYDKARRLIMLGIVPDDMHVYHIVKQIEECDGEFENKDYLSPFTFQQKRKEALKTGCLMLHRLNLWNDYSDREKENRDLEEKQARFIWAKSNVLETVIEHAVPEFLGILLLILQKYTIEEVRMACADASWLRPVKAVVHKRREKCKKILEVYNSLDHITHFINNLRTDRNIYFFVPPELTNEIKNYYLHAITFDGSEIYQ